MTNNKSSSTNLIAHNTLILYFRMLIVTLVGLYTSRIILKSLGVDDFGLYNVIGGVVSLFAFFRSSMEKCTQRFLNIEMVKGGEHTKLVFSNALAIHIAFAIIAFILAESIGLFILNSYIQIPIGREFAANCVYQTVIGGLLFTILTIPYSACIIAHERMGIFAWISIADCAFNLIIAFIISQSTYDKLIFYALLLFVSRVVNFTLYVIYCKRKFSETRGHIRYDKALIQQMLGYTSWTLLGHSMILGTNQGNSILVNMFHGVGANAAMAIANQVNAHILNLTGNFQTAFNPQITKSYASKEYNYLNSIIISTSKLSYFLLFLVALPLLINIDFVLNLWLENVPNETNIFCTLMLISGILQATTSPLNFSIMATGNIKWFQIITGFVFISDLFILYSLFSLGFSAPTAICVKIFIMVLVSIVRIFFAHRLIPNIDIKQYILKTFLPILYTTLICLCSTLVILSFTSTVLDQIVVSIAIVLLTFITIVFVGLDKNERKLLLKLLHVKKSI